MTDRLASKCQASDYRKPSLTIERTNGKKDVTEATDLTTENQAEWVLGNGLRIDDRLRGDTDRNVGWFGTRHHFVASAVIGNCDGIADLLWDQRHLCRECTKLVRFSQPDIRDFAYTSNP